MTIATQATLAALLAKTLTAPATEAKQDTGNTALATLITQTSGLATAAGQTSATTGLATLHTDLTGTLTAKAAGATVAGTLGALNAILDGITDLTGYASVSIQFTPTSFVGTVTMQVSNDGTNWLSKALTPSTTGSAGSTNGGSAIYSGPVGARYFRLNTTAYTSGSMAATIRYSTAPDAPIGQANSINTGSSIIGGIWSGTGSAPTAYSAQTAASTNATNVKTSAGNLYFAAVSNVTASDLYFKVYNNAAAPSVGSSTPVLTVKVATGATWMQEFGSNGMRFSAGIGWAATGAASSGDTTALTNAGALVHLTYA